MTSRPKETETTCDECGGSGMVSDICGCCEHECPACDGPTGAYQAARAAEMTRARELAAGRWAKLTPAEQQAETALQNATDAHREFVERSLYGL